MACYDKNVTTKPLSVFKSICITGTVAEGAPIIPISAQLKYNIEVVCEYIVKKIPIPLRDFTSQPRLIGERQPFFGFFLNLNFQSFDRLM